MQINITGHHVDITAALRAYVEDKFERLERHFDNMTNVHVILEVVKERQKAEATIHVSRGQVYADSEDENMYAAIDSLTDKLDRQIKKHKEKLKDHHRGEGLKNNEAAQRDIG
jgi:putative sigma-54 modulation protein